MANHVVGGNRAFAALLVGAEPPDRAADHLGADWGAAQRATIEALAAEFDRPGALQSVITGWMGPVPGQVLLDLRTIEQIGHGWDIAVATGQDSSGFAPVADEARVAADSLFQRLPLGDRRPFAPPVESADDDPLHRLLAALGRDPRWTPPAP